MDMAVVLYIKNSCRLSFLSEKYHLPLCCSHCATILEGGGGKHYLIQQQFPVKEGGVSEDTTAVEWQLVSERNKDGIPPEEGDQADNWFRKQDL